MGSELLFRIGTRENKCGYVNIRGEIVIPPRFDDAGVFADGLTFVEADGELLILNLAGGICGRLKNAQGVVSFSGGYLVFIQNSKFGVLDQHANVIVAPQFGVVLPVVDGRLVVRDGQFYGVLNIDGRWRIRPIYEGIYQFSHGCSVTSADRFTANAIPLTGNAIIINDVGEQQCDMTFAVAHMCSDGLIPVEFTEEEGGGIGWVDCMGQTVFQTCEFDQIGYCFANNTIVVRVREKWGVATKAGEFLVAPQYYAIGD